MVDVLLAKNVENEQVPSYNRDVLCEAQKIIVTSVVLSNSQKGNQEYSLTPDQCALEYYDDLLQNHGFMPFAPLDEFPAYLSWQSFALKQKKEVCLTRCISALSDFLDMSLRNVSSGTSKGMHHLRKCSMRVLIPILTTSCIKQ
jgi:hypothetical protein